jgi:hypothetical protein
MAGGASNPRPMFDLNATDIPLSMRWFAGNGNLVKLQSAKSGQPLV